MPPVLKSQRSLDSIATGYTVFEKDQVLRHVELNSLAEYSDDQTRLTRVRLLGVGLVCGLRASLAGGAVRVTKGVGITTDGDLLDLAADTTYDRFRPYDESFPAYAPLYADRDVTRPMLAAYELLPSGTAGSTGWGLGEFATRAGRDLASMTAVLLMESYVRDDDLCSGTDCDNRGQEAVNTLRLLLVSNDDAGALTESFTTPASACRALKPLVADRPAIPANLTTPAALAALYRTSCDAIHARLTAALPDLVARCAPLFPDELAADPAPRWLAKLNEYRAFFAGNGTGIQYYYSFLKDLVEGYDAFLDQLDDDTTVCVPDLASFPKHLVLGGLAGGADAQARRTGFYPSPLTSRTAGALDHARFLLRRLDALIAHFRTTLPTNGAIRVTPSAFEDRPLDERAVPIYYAPDAGGERIQRRWSYRLARRGMEDHTYSYHADQWGSTTGAANPLAAQIGRFPFFRVEGHLGKPVATVMAELEEQIRARNLPFSVRAVLLGADRKKVVKRPPRITDLHHLHQLVRKDLAHRLDEVERFNTTLMTRATDAVARGRVPDPAEEYEGVTVMGTVDGQGSTVARKSRAARLQIDQPYASYRAGSNTWQADLQATLQSAAEFKYNLGAVSKTEFVSPFDTLIGGTHAYWLPWLDDILRWRDDRADERLLFSRFAAQHPQLEHFGGVTRGGTLVLAHDEGNTVVADFMLPYHCCEEPAEADEPTLGTPDFRPPVLVENPVKILPSRTTFFEKEWVKVKPDFTKLPDLVDEQQKRFKDLFDERIRELGDWTELQKKRIDEILIDRTDQVKVLFEETRKNVDDYIARQAQWMDEKFQLQRELLMEKSDAQTQLIGDMKTSYFNVLKDSMEVVLSTKTATPEGMPGKFGDLVLGSLVEEGQTLTKKVELLRTQLKEEVNVPEEMRQVLTKQLTDAERALADNASNTAAYIATAKVDVTPGGEGFTAVMQVSHGITQLKGTDALVLAQTGVTDAVTAAPLNVQVAFNGMFTR